MHQTFSLLHGHFLSSKKDLLHGSLPLIYGLVAIIRNIKGSIKKQQQQKREDIESAKIHSKKRGICADFAAVPQTAKSYRQCA